MKHAWLVFLVALVVVLPVRLYQLFALMEEDTGFLNGGTATESTLSAKCVSFVLSPSGSGCTSCFGGTTTGSPQLVFIQSSSNQSVTEKRALVLRYVSPLTAIDGTYSRMGALVYNLKDYTVTL